ncbi:MAG: endonuclease [Candidatus Cloacimonetes bacterium]|nr:endonuclease [Candidatus Cloacimonadota bacterium]
MLKRIVILFVAMTVTYLYAQPAGYYDSVAGLTGDALKNGLHTLISTNTNTDYDGAKEEMFGYIDNHSNLVRCVYTGQDYSVPQGTMPNQTYLNCEHTFAQSWFGDSEVSTKRADINHLFPSNSNVNSSRGNLPFDVVVNVGNTFTYDNGYVSKRGSNINGLTCFEPADQHKGNLARALLYFNVRYNMTLTQGGINMLETLLQWNVSDPVDTLEQQRNDGIWEFQNNRNPFIDHPEYVDYIWGTATNNTVIQYMSNSITIPENYSSINISLSIINPSDQATTVEVFLQNGQPADVAGFDAQTVTFPANSSTSQQITISITDDTIVEGTETCVFGLRNLTGSNNPIVGPTSVFALTILDNDIPIPVALDADNISASGFTANWTVSEAVESFSFELATDSAFNNFVNGYDNLIVTNDMLTITGLYPQQIYYYRLRAFHNNTYGDYSNTVSVTTAQGSIEFATELFISEYIEGSSYNKAIEIYNGTGVPVDLSQYSLEKDTNANDDFSNIVTLIGTLQHNDVYIIYNSQASENITSIGDLSNNSVINFNGNDQVRLVKNGVELDRIGYAEDVNFAQNVTLVRKIFVDTPHAGPTDPQNNGEWDVYPSDTFDYLGFHDFVGVVNEENAIPSINSITLSSFPNPFAEKANIRLKLSENRNMTLNVYNLRGQLVSMIHSGVLSKGEHSFEWKTTGDLPSGIYFIRANSGKVTITNKTVLVK